MRSSEMETFEQLWTSEVKRTVTYRIAINGLEVTDRTGTGAKDNPFDRTASGSGPLSRAEPLEFERVLDAREVAIKLCRLYQEQGLIDQGTLPYVILAVTRVNSITVKPVDELGFLPLPDNEGTE